MSTPLSSDFAALQHLAGNLEQRLRELQSEDVQSDAYRRTFNDLNRVFETRKESDIAQFERSVKDLTLAELGQIDRRISQLFAEKKLVYQGAKIDCEDREDQTKQLQNCGVGAGLNLVTFKLCKRVSSNSTFGQILAIISTADLCFRGMLAVRASFQMFAKSCKLSSATDTIKQYCETSNELHRIVYKQQCARSNESQSAAALTDLQRSFFEPRMGPIRVPRSSESTDGSGLDEERVGATRTQSQLVDEAREATHDRDLAISKAKLIEIQLEEERARVQYLESQLAASQNSTDNHPPAARETIEVIS